MPMWHKRVPVRRPVISSPPCVPVACGAGAALCPPLTATTVTDEIDTFAHLQHPRGERVGNKRWYHGLVQSELTVPHVREVLLRVVAGDKELTVWVF